MTFSIDWPSLKAPTGLGGPMITGKAENAEKEWWEYLPSAVNKPTTGAGTTIVGEGAGQPISSKIYSDPRKGTPENIKIGGSGIGSSPDYSDNPFGAPGNTGATNLGGARWIPEPGPAPIFGQAWGNSRNPDMSRLTQEQKVKVLQSMVGLGGFSSPFTSGETSGIPDGTDIYSQDDDIVTDDGLDDATDVSLGILEANQIDPPVTEAPDKIRPDWSDSGGTDDWVWYDHDNDPSTADVFGPPVGGDDVVDEPPVDVDTGEDIYGGQDRGNWLWDRVKTSFPVVGIQWVLDQIGQGKSDEEILQGPPDIYDPTGEPIDTIGDNDQIIIGDDDGLVVDVPGSDDIPVEDPVEDPPVDPVDTGGGNDGGGGVTIPPITIGGGTNDDNEVEEVGAGDWLGDIFNDITSNVDLGGILEGGINIYGASEQADAIKYGADKAWNEIFRQYNTTRDDLADERWAGKTAIEGAGDGSGNLMQKMRRRLTPDARESLYGANPDATTGVAGLSADTFTGYENLPEFASKTGDWDGAITYDSPEGQQMIRDYLTATENIRAAGGKLGIRGEGGPIQGTEDAMFKSYVRALGDIENLNASRLNQEIARRGSDFGISSAERGQVTGEQLSSAQTSFAQNRENLDRVWQQLFAEDVQGFQNELAKNAETMDVRNQYWNEFLGMDAQEFEKFMRVAGMGADASARTGQIGAASWGPLASIASADAGARADYIGDVTDIVSDIFRTT